ncbi:MAG TPA: fumarylacetoacetate hydrolase family protein, partial [bacterium]|nr:fumarylacetoacetate hydrolase family protein [bacterium]
MKYISYERDGLQSIGIISQGRICDIPGAYRSFGRTGMSNTMADFLRHFDDNHRIVTDMLSDVDPNRRPELFFPEGQVNLLPPVPEPRSLRIYFGSKTYLQTAAKFYGQDILPDTLERPVFYFGNHQSILPPGSDLRLPRNTTQLDYELHLAMVVGRKGRNIRTEDARRYLAGFSTMNNWISRNIDHPIGKHMLYPPKSHDFGTSLGPCLVSIDELDSNRMQDKYDLRMTATINSELYTEGNSSGYSYSFSELLSDASRNCTLYPGDIISAGCIESGSILGLGRDV